MVLRTSLYHLARPHGRPGYIVGYSTGPSRAFLGSSIPFPTRSFRTHFPPRAASLGSKFKAPGTDILRVDKWSTRTKAAVAILGGCSAYYIYHLERAPVTGRLRFMDVSPKQERSLAEQTHRHLLSEFEGKILPRNHILSRHVRRVVNRILEGSHLGQVEGGEGTNLGGTPGDTWSGEPVVDAQDRESFTQVPLERDWKVLVVNDDNVVNAAVVNGIVIVFTGILPLCKDENGLAAVIGHEIAHVLARHAAERISTMRIFTILALLLDPLLGIDFQLTQFLTTYAFQLPNSRTQELEADRIGLTLTAQACYDPQVVPDMQKRLTILESRRPKDIEFLQTHPSSARRAKVLETYLPDAYTLQAASSFCAGMATQISAFSDALASASEWSRTVDDKETSEWVA